MRNVTRAALAIAVIAILLNVGSSLSKEGIKPPYCASADMKASYYAGNFIGRRTANGQLYTARALTAAHKTLPFGTRLKVTNKDNGKSVMVVINDRGPYVKGRSLDLSLAAAERIGMVEQGVAQVTIESCGKPRAPQPYLRSLASNN